MSSTLPPLLFSHRKTLEKETADNRLSFLAQNASSGEAVVVLLLGFLLLVLMVCAEWGWFSFFRNAESSLWGMLSERDDWFGG